MKKKYVTPTMVGERFSADEYVAACVEGVIQCRYPGESPYRQDDGTDTYKDQEGLWHGLCGNDASISFADVNNEGTGYEVVNGRIDRNRPISGIVGYELKPGTYNNVSWTSTEGKYIYHHNGRLVINNIDNNHPNHS